MMSSITCVEVHTICRRFNIASQHYRCFVRLFKDGTITSKEFGDRLHGCRNYKQASDALMHATGPDVTRQREELLQWATGRTNAKVAQDIVGDVFATLGERDVRNPRLALFTMASRKLAAGRAG